MWPYCGHFQIHKHLWLLDQLGDSLIQFAVVNLKDFYFKSQNRSWAAKVSSNWKLSFSISDHISRSSQLYTWPRMVTLILSTYSTLIVTHVFLVSILHYKPCHIPLNCKCLIKKSDHIGPHILDLLKQESFDQIEVLRLNFALFLSHISGKCITSGRRMACMSTDM